MIIELSLDLLTTSAIVVDDAIRFVFTKSKEKLKPSAGEHDEESQEPDYDEDEDRLEEEQQEEEAGQIATTTNQVF